MADDNRIIKIISGERFTPFGLAKKLGASVILESSSFKKGRDRYSLLMVTPAFTVTETDEGIIMHRDGKDLSVKSKGKDILDVLLYFARQHSIVQQDFPYPAGGIGYLSYEFARRCDTIRFCRKEDPLGLPDAAFIFGHVFVVFDHFTDNLYLIGLNYREHRIDLESAVREIEEKIGDLDFNYLREREEKYYAYPVAGDGDKAAYEAGVEKVREEIIKGNLLQGVLSRRLRIETDMPAMEAYRRLRSDNPSPYLFYIDFGGYSLFGSSPEMHVKVKNGRVSVRPIAGTRRRGRSDAEDKRLEQDLLEDPKERAEHLMLVDLARNDLGRVCRPGSVRVSEYMEVDRYSHVMHIVSTVEGDLEEEKTGIDAVRATFPAGTVSGAPKIRAVETIDALEALPRRFYAGLVGYVEPEGNLDTCITIRSGLKKGNEMVLQAGAGIVYDSRPEREYEETGEKLGALAAAVGITL